MSSNGVTFAAAIIGGLVALGIILVGIRDARRGHWLGLLLLCGLAASACAVVLAAFPISQPYKSFAWWATGSMLFMSGLIVGRQLRRQRDQAHESNRSGSVVGDHVD